MDSDSTQLNDSSLVMTASLFSDKASHIFIRIKSGWKVKDLDRVTNGQTLLAVLPQMFGTSLEFLVTVMSELSCGDLIVLVNLSILHGESFVLTLAKEAECTILSPGPELWQLLHEQSRETTTA